MIYLILAIASSALISVLMRVSERYRKNHLSMLAMNYVMCSLLAWATNGSANMFAPAEGLGRTVVIGVVAGVLYLASFMMLQWNISKNGVVLPSTFMKLGVVVPTLMAILIFGETPRVTQVMGILAAIGAIFLIQDRGSRKAGSIGGLVALLLVGGVTDCMAKIYEELGAAALSNQYLLCTFGAALILCVLLCAVKKQRLSLMDAVFGLAIGVPNYFSSRFLLKSLETVPAVAAYPTFSVGTIILVTVAGVLLFKERLDRRKVVALGVILVALALLNL